MMNNFLRSKKKEYYIYIIVFLFIYLFFFLKKNSVLFINENYIVEIGSANPVMFNDVIEENESYKINGKDPYLVYDCEISWCRGIRIKFDAGFTENCELQIFFLEKDQTFEEKNSIRSKISKGEDTIDVPVILQNISKIRIDINGLENGEFNIINIKIDERRIDMKVLNTALFSFCVLLLILIIFSANSRNILTKKNLIYIVFFLMFQSFFLIIIMADQSAMLHPDESVTKSAIDYYLNHYFPPDVRSNSIANSFSAYGNTRLHELSVYYFLAGKIGGIFKVIFNYENYFRVFNVLLYFFLIVLILYKAKNEFWLLFILTLTPQLWYIFSYATSDAWDYFCSVLLLFQSTATDSILNKTLRGETKKKESVFAYLIFGILSAFIIMGKKNYWTVLLVLFTIFLFKIIDCEKNRRKKYIRSYAIILICFAGTLVLRYSINIYYYGLDENKIYSQVREERAQYEFKSSTPIEEQFASIRLHDKGVKLNQLIESEDKGGYGLAEKSFKSFVGLYGVMNKPSGEFYYFWMKIMYVILITMIYFNILKQEVGTIRIYETMIITIIMLLSIVLSIYNSWFMDFQAQGRYLFPMIIGFSYVISKDQKKMIVEKKWCLGLIILIQISSMISFYKYGLIPLI